MAIESAYWKEELSRIAKSLRPVVKPKRWSERAACVIERDVMIGCFVLRRLIELHKVSSQISKLQIKVFNVRPIKPITRLNKHNLESNYDWQNEKTEHKPILYVCNQCIHAYVSQVIRNSERNWSDLFVVSDFDRNKAIFRMPLPGLHAAFEAASKDWPTSLRMKFDVALGDYRMETD